ncbi:MAG TPA: DUF4149 domain-containing protein [Methylomirabilota bacterium]|nr:DUF4149 domain-containing protein [Methylomirabilota bacterium]
MKMVTIVAISAWLGVLAFLAFVVAPAAFGSLERGAAARLISVVMPRYHWVGLGLGIVALIGILARGETAGSWWDRLPLLLVLLMLALTAGSLFALLPRIEALRDAAMAARAAGEESAPALARFRQLHTISSLSGTGVLIAGAGALVAEALRGRSGP